jgi:hypothetical protein
MANPRYVMCIDCGDEFFAESLTVPYTCESCLFLRQHPEVPVWSAKKITDRTDNYEDID